MKIKRGWQKRFADVINRDLRAYEKEGLSEQNRWIICGMKDTIYLLGESLNQDYRFANGFRKFCEEMGIDFEKIGR